ncbi:hypothetical protein [uncultured Legionella sp.]|uniref:hypothetical protein n=1 Tax=uncultured Legionella sp. TaxID=210934 RepID=UPI00260FE3A1|nr:hypothetical protein [uncultured Legionella sp.]
MNMFKILIIYLGSYYFFGVMLFLFLFGFTASLGLLKSSPFNGDFNGTVILLSAFLASLMVIALMKKRLLSLPYPYFMLGFYIGNVSLLIIFLLNGLLHGDVIWKFPEVFLVFLAPFMTLVLSYIAGFAFWALIPSLLSAYVLFKACTIHNQK